MSGVRHLYVHLPFCAHRCGYCDFVTSVGREAEHLPYAEALVAELERRRHVLADPVETVFVGGGTPTFMAPAALRLVLEALPAAAEVTVEANPETITPALVALLRESGVNRISLGAQSFQPHLLQSLERRAGPEQVRDAVAVIREAGIDNLSLDLIYGIPDQTLDDLARDLEEVLELEPEHLSAYELEAKPGTRFTHAYGVELERQAEALEGYLDTVVDTMLAADLRWYETANFCRVDSRDLRARHNLGYWKARDYLGVGVGAVSTVDGRRTRNHPSVGRYLRALSSGEPAPGEVEELDDGTRAFERVMLGLRLDEPFPLAGLEAAIDETALARLAEGGLVERDGDAITLTRRGRLLGDAVTAELLR